MKKILIALITIAFSITAMAQKTEKDEKDEKKVDVPAIVKDAFTKEFPTVKKVVWGAEDNDFEAEFKLNGVDCSANFDKTGHRTELETTIKNDQLPKAALDYISKNFSTYKIVEVAKNVNDKNVTTYESELGLNGKTIELIFDANGKFLKQADAD